LAALLLFSAWPPNLQARSLVIESFHADVGVNVDGSIDVTETIRPRFAGSWNGIFRTIPVEYRTPQGMNYTLFLDLLDITDEAGNRLQNERSRDRHYLKVKIWVPGAQDATRTVVLRYRVHNALRFFTEHDELYWNVTGDEWQAPIQTALTTVRLPDGVTGLRAVAFTGVYGAQEQAASVATNLREVTVRTLRRLNFREGLTVAIGWDPGIVRRPGPLVRAHLFLRSNWVFAVPVGMFGLMWWLWCTRGRDPRRRPIAPQYEPPEGLTPAELGTLLDNTPDMRDITATLVDLAVRGYLTIEEREERKLLGLLSKTEYAFHLRKSPADWDTLQPHEQALLDALFGRGGRRSVDSADLENRFYTFLAEIRNRIFASLIGRGYYARRPDKVRALFVVLGIGCGVALTVLLSLISAARGQSPVGPILAGLLSAACVIGFGWVMPARTVRGARALEGVLGFEEFLSRVEGDRLQRVAKRPELFEKYLPYAMALGVEKNWATAFEHIYRQPPDWYHGGDPTAFHPRSFTSSLADMTTRTAAAMASAPRSSGGSGFSGGGSSGGGRGGGGGGGF
jgi:uncharacterized protein (TIGR04222 family)